MLSVNANPDLPVTSTVLMKVDTRLSPIEDDEFPALFVSTSLPELQFDDLGRERP